MNTQKGFSAIHIVVLLILVGLGAVSYTYYQKSADKKFNAESEAKLVALSKKFNDKLNIASSTPRIGITPVLNEMDNIKTEISNLPVSDCMKPAKEALVQYATNDVKVVAMFASNKADPVEEAKIQETNKQALNKFQETTKKCNPV